MGIRKNKYSSSPEEGLGATRSVKLFRLSDALKHIGVLLL
jgi:hypothetical protein